MKKIIDPQILFGTELECLTYIANPQAALRPEMDMDPMIKLVNVMRKLAPSLPGEAGIYNGYGRVYIDCGHVEMATCECDSPEMLASVVERQQQMLTRAARVLREGGTDMHLSCNNHDGLLRRHGQTWGSHENYLLNIPPKSLPKSWMPFLVSRFYAGAGGLSYPTGRYLMSVRAEFMEGDADGSTTGRRALHSTSRAEHHVGRTLPYYRYHLILGDGHRSHFNLALQFGASALTLRAIQGDRRLTRKLARLNLPHDGSWLATMHSINVLAEPGEEPRVPTLALAIQRLFLESCERWLDEALEPPSWAPQTIEDWRRCLDAAENDDHDWLSSHLDMFAKYELTAAALEAEGHSWSDLPENTALFSELAQLDQDYHDFTSDDSPFALAERAGLMDHRVGPMVEAGSEPTPFVPQTLTRANARGRFLHEHGGSENLIMSWACVSDTERRQVASLRDPFAAQFSDWADFSPATKELPIAIREQLALRRRTTAE